MPRRMDGASYAHINLMLSTASAALSDTAHRHCPRRDSQAPGCRHLVRRHRDRHPSPAHRPRSVPCHDAENAEAKAVMRFEPGGAHAIGRDVGMACHMLRPALHHHRVCRE